MINAFCGAAVLFLVSLLQSHRMGSVLYWYLGDLGSCGREQSMLWTMIFLFGCLVLCCFGHFLNILLLGEETARTLGLEAEKVTVFLLIFVSCLVCLAVAAAGPLGFVGLVVPQILRHFFPYDHRILLPACMMGGSFFLLFCDTLSRTLPEQGELPAGVLTALVGAPVFIMLLRSKL
jgi:iron complex transport system permease protein